MATKRLITTRQFAEATRYTPARIYQLIKEGRIKALRVGDGTRALRIPETELERFLAGKMGGSCGKES